MCTETIPASEFLPAERMSPELLLDCNRQVSSWPPLLNLMQQAGFGIVLLNEQRQAVYANPCALHLADTTSAPAPIGLRTGELFGCANATIRQGGCGTSLACRACHLANSIQEALAWGQGTGTRDIFRRRAGHAPLHVSMHNASVVVGNGRLLLCRLGDFSPLPPTPASAECPVELRELYLALTEPQPH